MGRLLALAVALMLGAVIAWACERPPEPKPASVSPVEFSAERAMADVRVIAARPHPLGSPENAAVEAYLVRRMTGLGLSVSVRDGDALQVPKWLDGAIVGGSVRNVVGVLPGRDRNAPALALMAHYDSAPGSPGAADDAAGVAAALEIARAIQARGVPARDVMLVITDGEEAGLLGASAFFQRDPLARRIGFVVNMEARGGGGRVQMFQTGPQNGGAIAVLRQTAVRPAASSMFGFVYERMPNDTDFTEARKAGVTGLNYAFIGRQFDYHAPTSTPANLDRGSLQDLGDQVLATAGAIAFAPALPAKAPNVVYGHVFGDLLVAYSPALGWLVLLAAAGLIALAGVQARRLEAFRWTEVVRGAGAGLYVVAGAVAVLHVARQATGADVGFVEQRYLLAQVSRWEIALFALALGFLLFAAAELARGRRLSAILLPLAAGIGSCLFAGGLDKVGLGSGLVAALLALATFGRPVTRPAGWSGVLMLGLLVALVAQAFVPLAAFVVAWPLTVAAIAAAATAMGSRRDYVALSALALVCAVTLGWLGGLAHLTFLSLDLPELLALPLLLAGLALWPLAQPDEGAPPARWVGATLLVLGAVVLVGVRYGPPWNAVHPEASRVQYHVDQDARRAWRISAAPNRTPWSDAVLRADGGQIAKRETWLFRTPVDAAPARFLPLPGPEIGVSALAGGGLAINATPPAGARVLSLQLRPDTAMRLASINGVPAAMALKPGAWTRIRWENAPRGVRLALQPGGPGRLEVRYAATTDGWPRAAAPLPRRPAALMPFDVSDSTVVTGTRGYAW
jgi:hypothetical protein